MILLYHKVYPESHTIWWVTVDSFYRQMVELTNKNIVYLDNYNPENQDQVVITFDGVYKNILTYAAPILKYFNYPFELFITNEFLGKKNEFDNPEPLAEFCDENDLKKLIEFGGRLQWHSNLHSNLKDTVDLKAINNELYIPERTKSLDINGFNWFAYPYGEYNDFVINETKKLYRGALSCTQGDTYDIYKLNRTIVTNSTSLTKNKIALIIASYNYGCFLPEAIESAIRQTIPPNEILITDDYSEDDTQKIAEFYVKKYPELIKYNRNEKNLGIIDHFNKAIQLTTSEFVMFLGADNRLLSNYIEETSKILNKDENIAIAYTDYALFGKRSRLIYDNFPEDWKGTKKENYYLINFPEFNESSKHLLLGERNFIHGSSMFRRNVFFEVGGYKDSGSNPEDYDLFKRIIKKNYLAQKASNTLLEYRQHSREQANMQYNSQQYLRLLLTQLEEKDKIINSLKNSKAYRLGKFILRPLSYMRNFIK